MGKIWNLDACINNAKKYSTIKDWTKNSRGAYLASIRNGWSKECTQHMIKLGSRFKRMIYAFEFPDKSVYIGLTFNSSLRKERHLNPKKNKKSTVYRYFELTGLLPEFKEKTEYLDFDIASEQEGIILNFYLENGWKILNRIKTGGLGGSVVYWTKDRCVENAKLFSSKKMWSLKSSRAYAAAKENGWFDECVSHMKRPIVHNKKWTLETCQNEALKFKFLKDWYLNSRSSYITAVRNNWLNLCKSHFYVQA